MVKKFNFFIPNLTVKLFPEIQHQHFGHEAAAPDLALQAARDPRRHARAGVLGAGTVPPHGALGQHARRLQADAQFG